MNRKQLEREIAKKLKEIKKLYYEAYPEGDYLSLCIFRDSIEFHNNRFDENKLDYFEQDKRYR